MAKKNLSGNEAVSQAALASGVKVITGYPGTPSSEAIGSIWKQKIDGVHVEWSTNEKVALEIALAASWAGQRALCTMKMSGLNVAYDSLISYVYTGCTGGMVLYVCDDPGVAAGMPEQDVRGFALMSDMPVLEPSSVLESYTLTQYAFELSEAIQGPVMLRSVTNVAQSHAIIEVPESKPFAPREPQLVKDAAKYTKAGAKICMDQHRDLIARLAASQEKITKDGKNKLALGQKDGLGLVTVGAMNSFLSEALDLCQENGLETKDFSFLRVVNSNPLPTEIDELIAHCGCIAVVEENEPYVEKGVFLRAYHAGKIIPIAGKEDGTLSRIGSFNAVHIVKAIYAALGKEAPQDLVAPYAGADALQAVFLKD